MMSIPDCSSAQRKGADLAELVRKFRHDTDIVVLCGLPDLNHQLDISSDLTNTHDHIP